MTYMVQMDLNEYPELLKPRDVQRILGISKERSYALFHLEGFPKVITGKSALCVPKARLIEWLGYGSDRR